MNGAMFRVLFVNFDEADYKQVGNLLDKIQTFQCQRYRWCQGDNLNTMPPAGYDAYVIDGHFSQEFSHLVYWMAGLHPVPVIWLVDRSAQGMELLAAGAADYWLRDQLFEPIVERSLRLTIAYPRQLQPKPAQVPTGKTPDFWQKLLDTIPALIYVYDLTQQSAVYVNREISQWLTYIPDPNMPNPNIPDPKGTGDPLAPTWEQVQQWYTVADGKICHREIRLQDIWGNDRYLDCVETVFSRAGDGRVQQILGVASDSTACKQIAAQRQQRQLLMENMLNSLPQLVYIYDLKTAQNLYFNQKITQILGYSQQEVQQGGWNFLRQRVHPDDAFIFQQLFSDRFQTLGDGEVICTEYRLKHKNGSWRCLSCQNVVFTRDPDGMPVQILGTAIDITDNQLIWQQLSQSEAQLYNMLTNSIEGLLIVDPQGVIRFANRAAAKLFNQPLEDLLEAELQWPMAVGQTTELEIMQSSGQIRIGEMLVSPSQFPGESLYVVSLRDITEHRQAQSALRESEERFRQLAENIEDVFWLLTLVPLKILYVSPAYEKIWGKTCDSLYENPLNLFDSIYPEDSDRFRMNLHRQTLGESSSLEYRIVRGDGEIRWIYERSFPVMNKRGKVLRIAGISEDITERKKNTEALQVTHQQLEFHLENSPLGFIEWTQDYRVSQWSGTAEKIFGWSSFEAIGKRYDDWGFIYEESWEYFAEVLDRMTNKKQPRMIFETINTTKNGTHLYCQWYNSILLNSQGEFLSLFSFVLDVSDRHRAELALKQSEERFRAIFEQAAIGMSICTLNGQFFRVNQKLCDIVGYTCSELLERTFQNITILRDRRENEEYISQLLNSNIFHYSMEKRYISKTGEIVWVNVMVSLMRDQHNQPKYFIYAVEDISDRKRAELALINSEERFRVIFQQAAVGIFRRSISGEFLQLNRRFCEILGYNEAELLNRNFQSLIHPEDLDQHLNCLNKLIKNQIKAYELEEKYIKKDGEKHWVKIVVSVVNEAEEKPKYLIGIVEDIQERKTTEIKLQYRLAVESAVAQVSRQLVTSQSRDIKEVLKTIGLAVGANRVFVKYFTEKCRNIAVIAEWHNGDQFGEAFEDLSAVKYSSADNFPWWMQQLNANENIIISHIDSLPVNANNEREYFQSMGVRSVLAVPIFTHDRSHNGENPEADRDRLLPGNYVGNLWGSIDLHSYEINQNWSNEDAQMLRLVGEMIYSYFSRLQTEAELRDSEALYAGIFDHSAESIFLLDIQDNGELIYQTINPTNEQLFQMSRLAVVGKSLSAVRSPQYTRNFRQKFQECLKTQKAINYEETIELPQGNRNLLTTLVPIADSTGKIIKIQGSSRDITTQKQVEAALQEAKEAADAANRAKSVFLANMSHELRTPLNAILGFTQLLVRNSQIKSEQREQLEIIMRSGEHLLALINDILDLSKIEAGRITLNVESFNLERMLDNLYDMLDIRSEIKGLKFNIIRSKHLPKYIKADQNKLRQILINLLGNAIKFTKAGSVTLEVTTSSESSAIHSPEDYQSDLRERIATANQFNARPRDPLQCDRLIVAVTDTGQGIAREELPRLFDAFFQSQSGKQSNEGTGLGLAISQQFVKLMGGQIAVESTLGKGSVFKFDIQFQPVAADELEELLAQREIEVSTAQSMVIGLAPNQPHYRILVVEDIWASRKLLVKLLEQIGFEVQQASHGEEAVSIWHSWQPHLIFMDIRMPVMDGYQATKEIRASVNGEAPIIIALTANAFESERAAIISAGCNDFLPKPFPENLLLDKISFYLGVKYIYQESCSISADAPAITQRKMTPEDLAVMSSEWISQLHFAALSARGKIIQQLIQKIPQENQLLIQGLTELFDNLDFDTLVFLSKN
jgi:two-component system sensor histidine kinase/response regulator